MPTTSDRGPTRLQNLLLVLSIVSVAMVGCKDSSSRPVIIAPPVLSLDQVVTDEDNSVVFAPLLNDEDPQGEPLGIVSVTLPQNGTVVINPDATLTYTPNADFNGVDNFGYMAANASGLSAEGGVEILVLAVNDVPVAEADLGTVDEDGLVEIDVLANDSDVEDPTLVVSDFSQGANGSVIPSNGLLQYTPALNFNGRDSFTYTVQDGEGAEATGTVTIDVAAINDEPLLLPDFIILDEDAVTVISVLDNDVDVDGDALELVNFGLRPRSGTAVINSDNTITYTPNFEFSGTDAFTYVATDGVVSLMAAVSVTVNPINDLPIVGDDQAFTQEDTGVVIDVLANDSDIEGSPLSIVGTTPPSLGAVTIDVGGTLTYAPNANVNGTDTFSYTVTDGSGISTGTVTINIGPVNDPPVAFDDDITTQEDTAITFAPLANDTDVDGTPLSFFGTPRGVTGNVIVNGDNTITYTPGPNFNGTDSFTYTATDGTLNSTATIFVTIIPVNDVPLPQPDNAFTDEDTVVPIQLDVLANDVDLDRDPLLVSSVSPAANGTTALFNPVAGLASFVTYVPNPNFAGTDSFTYTVTDQNGGTAQTTVTVTVNAIDDPPEAQGDAVSTDEDNPVTIFVLNNDIEIDGEELNVIATSTPANGTVLINSDNSITYTPAENFFGTDTFLYTISDESGSQSEATVAILVRSVNDLPVALGDVTTTMEDQEVLVPILDNDFDPDGDTLSIVGFNPPQNGTASIVDDKMLYIPNPNFFGTDVFNYTVTDGNGGNNTERAVVLVSEVNDDPVATEDFVNTAEDTEVLISPLTNDVDVDGDPLQIIATTPASSGSLTLNGPDTLLYTPVADFVGSATFTYTVSDGRGGVDTTQVTVTIQRTNDAPQGGPDSVATDEDVAVTIDVLANDVDVDGDPLEIVDLLPASNGSVVLNADNTITYTPDANFNGADSFNYNISDNRGGSDLVQVTVQVLPVNDAPVANDDVATTDEDVAVTILVADNDSDVDGDPLTVSILATPDSGAVALNGNAILYTPIADFFGSDSFTYTLSDGVESRTASVSVTVLPINDPPSLRSDTADTLEDNVVIIDVLLNDGDPDGDTLTISALTQPAAGTAVTSGGGSVTYTPNANFNGTDTFSYTVTDGNGGVASDVVTIIVEAVNDSPVATDDSITTDEDTAIEVNVIANDTDVEGDMLTLVAVQSPSKGTAVISGPGLVTYTPNTNDVGVDQFSYTVSDPQGLSVSGLVTVQIVAINDAPLASDDNASTDEEVAVVVDVLANDFDVDNDPLTLVSFTQGSNGVVTENANGTLTYDPEAAFFGSDSFTYTIDDGNGESATATVTVLVFSSNDAPVAEADSATTDEEIAVIVPVLDNDSDEEGDPLTVVAVSQGANGSVALNGDGTVTYTPAVDFAGTDTFTYTVSDGSLTGLGLVDITVNPVNDPPVAVEDSASTDEDVPVEIAVLDNDFDVDGDLLTLESVTAPSNGTTELTAAGTVLYTPATNFNGSDSFEYTINDGNGSTATALVTVLVNSVDDPPLAGDDVATTDEDQVVLIDVLANDSDPEGQTLTLVEVTKPVNGTALIDGSQVSYAPNPDFNGVDSFLYQIVDEENNTVTATVTVTVNPVNDAPIAIDDFATTLEAQAVDIAVLDNDVDVDLDTLELIDFTQGANGAVSSNADGSLRYAPTGTFFGTDSFSYTITDGNGEEASALVTVTVEDVNFPPVVTGELASTNEETDLVLDLLANDSDPDGDLLMLVQLGDPSNGSVVETAPGVVTYTPATDFFGPDSFTYTVSDGNFTVTSEVMITVNRVQDPPIANDDLVSTLEDEAIDIAVLDNDIDVDSNSLNIVSFGQGSVGTVTDNGDGTLRYTPQLNANGGDSFLYEITDGNGQNATARVLVTIIAANDEPILVADSATTEEDAAVSISVLANDSDEDGDTLTLVEVTLPNNGTATINSDSTITYLPAADFNGVDTFSYVASDGTNNRSAQVTVTVTPVNDDPVAVDDSATTNEDMAVSIAVLANDSDIDGDALSVDAFSPGANGSVALNSDGTLLYTPNADFSGSDSFTYTISDGAGGSATAAVSVTVEAQNDPPVAVADNVVTDEDVPVTFDVVANDTDLEGDTLTVESVDAATNGNVEINTDGTLTYTPDENFNGADAFNYVLSDGENSVVGNVLVVINAVNDAPNAVDDVAMTVEDTQVEINVLLNDNDVEGSPLTIAGVTSASNGSTEVLAGGVIRYTPDVDFLGLDTFTYEVSDGDLTATARVDVTVSGANDTPLAVDDLATVDEDSFVVIDVLFNDSDVDGDTLTVVNVTLPSNGTTILNADNTVTYAPSLNFNGADAFSYTISDGNGASATAQVLVTIDPVADTPVAANDSAVTLEDTPANIEVLANDSDGDGDPLSIVAVGLPMNGSATLESDNTITYAPATDFTGVDSFSYTLSDGDPTTTNVMALVTVTINPVNDPPVANADSAVTDEDLLVVIDVLANDTDEDPSTLQVQATRAAALGSVEINGDNTLTYTPNANVFGVDTFTYTVVDTAGLSATASVTVTINAVNDLPEAVADFATTDEEVAVNVSVLANDSDVDGDPLTVTIIGMPLPSGTTTLEADGSITYTPQANFNGEATFLYTVSDGTASADALVTISVAAVNDAPVALDDSALTDEDTAVAINVLDNDSDEEGDTLSISATTTPANGSISVNGAVISYTPTLNFNGSDSFEYTISDGNGANATATVTILVTAVNDAPVANADDVSVDEDETVTIDVLANDSDVDGDPLQIAAFTPPLAGSVIAGAGGALEYTPDADFNGSDQFDYTLSDGTVEVLGTVFITVLPINDAPVAVDDTAVTAEETAVTIMVLANDTDVDNDTLTVASFTAASDGDVTNPGDGTLVYTPAVDFNGTDTFTYTVTDGAIEVTANVTVTVNNVNDAPIAVDDSVTTDEDMSVEIDVLANDSDPEGSPLSVVSTGAAANGSVVLDGDLVIYSPDLNFFGVDTFLVTITDGRTEASSTVTVTVNSVNDAPTARDDSATTPEETPITIAVLLNDDDVEGDPLTVVGFTPAANGAVTDPGDGTLTYSPNANFAGVDSFTYTISDGSETASATVTVTVTGLNDAPIVADDSATTDEDVAVFIDVLANDVDADGDTLTITLFAQGTNGSVTTSGAGLSYAPDADFNGDDTFTYTVSDGTVEVTATVNVTVNAVNDAPNAVADVATTDEDTAVVVDVLANDSDVDGDTLALESFTQGANGSVVTDADGLSYLPNADFNGSDSFTYTITDGVVEATATVEITVDAVNDAPLAADDLATTNEDETAIIDALANDSDIDGDMLEVSSVTDGSNGSVSTTGGMLEYTPNLNFNGSDTFTYTITDGIEEASATVTVTVNSVNDLPIAMDDNASTREDTPVVISVLANDIDVDGDLLTVLSATAPANGDVTNPGDGTLVYTPVLGFNGIDSFSYTVSDGNGGEATANVMIQVALVNEAPIANADVVTTDEDQAVDIAPLANDSDADGDTLTLVSFTAPSNGSLVDLGAGVLRYTPDANFNGSDSFSTTISDGTVQASALVTITINPVNDDPIAVADSGTTDEDVTLLLDVLANDSDVDGDPLTIVNFTDGANGTVAIGGGALSYSPNADFNGTDLFSYTLSDGTVEVTATVEVTVNPVQDAPLAVNDLAMTTEENTVVIDVLANDSDADGDALSIVDFGAPANGAIESVAGGLAYTPNDDFTGSDSFTYTITDGLDNATATVTISIAGVNDAPVAVADVATTLEDEAVLINVLGNDSDADGDALTVTAFSTAANGMVTSEVGGLLYTPNADFNGSDNFTYTISDGVLEATATVTITISPVNDDPVANDDVAVTDEDVAVTVDVLANDQDIDGDTLTISSFTTPANGSVSADLGGLTYTPDASFNGADAFSYTISDGTVEVTANVTVTVNAINDAPIANDDLANTDEDNAVNVDVLANDEDLDGDTLTISSFTTPANGMVSADLGGLTYTPNADFNGADSFNYTISDGTVEATATVQITVNAVNDAPIAVNDTATTDEEITVVIAVLANDSDVDGDPLTVLSFTTPADGVVSNPGDGTLLYTPAFRFNGTDTFNYTISDGNGGEATASVTIQVAVVNEAPVAADDVATLDEDASLLIDVLANDSDGDADPLTIVSFTNPTNGALTPDAVGFVYTPNADFNGSDSFTYTISDGVLEATATVSITVNPVNDDPVANDDVAVTDEDVPVNVDVLANDQDIDGDTLTISSFTTPANGSVSADLGGLTYTPDANFNGADAFSYTISDGTVEVTANVTVTVNAINDAPIANDDLANTDEDTAVNVDVLANDEDLDGDTLTISSFTTPANGMVSADLGGLTYTPNADFNGADSFSYTISDGTVEAIATVQITVNAVNDAPIAVNDTATTDEEITVVIAVLANDSDVDGDPLTVLSFTTPADGVVSNPGDGTLLYTPAFRFNGTDTFNYTISDGNGGEATASVTIQVAVVNEAPVAADDVATLDEDASLLIDVLANDSDGDADPLTIVSFTNPSNGALTPDAVGFVYTPNADFNGSDSFTYTISDGVLEATATVSITVNPVNDDPVANDDVAVTDEDVAVNVDVLANDQDIDGDTLTISSFTTPANGSVSADLGGLTYTPDANFNGADAFSYTISDGTVEVTANVTVTVNAINDAPIANDDLANTDEDTAVNVDVLANDEDLDGDTLTISSFTTPANGMVSADLGGLTYTPNADFNGADSFSYTISDGTVEAIATVQVTVNAVNDNPVANDDVASTDEDNSVNVDVLANDSDVDGDTLTIVSFTTPANGVVTADLGGLTYTPDADFNGVDSFDYTISDGTVEATATVNVTINAVNDAPNAADDLANTDEDNAVTVDVLANDNDLDGDALTISSFTAGANGSVSADAGGLVYTPDADFNGADSFTYTISDGTDEATATVEVTVNAVNDAPIVENDVAITDEDTAVTVDVVANDSDVDADPLELVDFTSGSFGLVTSDLGGLTYTPDADFNGSDSFTYTITDGTVEATATVMVTVNAVNDAPTAAADLATTDEDNAINVDVLANDADVDGDSVSIVGFTNGALGVVTAELGGLTYTPNANANGSDSFSYTISDGTLEATAAVQITINSVNDLPVALDDLAATDEDVSVTIAVLANDSDVDADPLTVITITAPANGMVSNPGDGTVIYTPEPGFSGNDTFSYTIADGNGGEASATVNVSIALVNVAPVAADDAATLDEDTSVLVDVLANDSDADGDPLTLVDFTLPANGTLTSLAAGFTYTPEADFSGTDSFTYTISDGLEEATALVTLTVTAINDAPVLADDLFDLNLNIDLMVNLEVLTNDDDADDDTLTITAVTQPDCGTVTINVNQTSLNVSLPSCMATQTFTYTVSDGTETATATVTIQQEPTPAFDFTLFAPDITVDFDLICDGGICTDVDFTVPVLLQENTSSPGFPNNVAAFGLQLSHNSALLSLDDVGVGADLALVNGGSGPDFYMNDLFANGFTVTAIISDSSSDTLAVATPREIVEIEYTLHGDAVAGNALGTTTTLTWNNVTTTLTIDGYNPVPQAIDIPITLNPVANVASFHYLINSGGVPYDPSTGDSTFTRTVALLDSTTPGSRTPFRGVSMGVTHDPAVVSINAVLEGEALAMLNGGSGPDFFQPEIDPDGEPGFVLGVIFNLSNPSFTITAGSALDLVEVEYNTVPAEFLGNTGGSSSTIMWTNALGSPAVSNLVVITGGGSIAPQLNDGLLIFVPQDDFVE